MSPETHLPPGETPPAARTAPGYALYTRRTLRLYDAVVYGFNSPFLWRCAAPTLVEHYRRGLSGNHLDVGVGTGYLLDRADPPPGTRLTLLDANPSCLAATARRLSRYAPQVVEADLFDLPPSLGPFDSIGMHYVLHCLPGGLTEKLTVVDALSRALTPTGRLFGSTIVQGGVRRSALARALMDAFNRRGVFSNARDRIEDLAAGLDARFAEVRVERHGSVALFSAERPSCAGRMATDRQLL